MAQDSAGSCRQSMNTQIGAPGLQAARALLIQTAVHSIQLSWSFWSPSKSGRALSALILLYFWLVVRVFSLGFAPPPA